MISRPAQIVITALLLAAFFAWGYRSNGDAIQQDCTHLNQTIINGQHIICKPYNPEPMRVL